METFRKPDAYKSLNSSSVILDSEMEEENVFLDDSSTVFYSLVENLKKLLVGET